MTSVGPLWLRKLSLREVISEALTKQMRRSKSVASRHSKSSVFVSRRKRAIFTRRVCCRLFIVRPWADFAGKGRTNAGVCRALPLATQDFNPPPFPDDECALDRGALR